MVGKKDIFKENIMTVFSRQLPPVGSFGEVSKWVIDYDYARQSGFSVRYAEKYANMREQKRLEKLKAESLRR